MGVGLKGGGAERDNESGDLRKVSKQERKR